MGSLPRADWLSLLFLWGRRIFWRRFYPTLLSKLHTSFWLYINNLFRWLLRICLWRWLFLLLFRLRRWLIVIKHSLHSCSIVLVWRSFWGWHIFFIFGIFFRTLTHFRKRRANFEAWFLLLRVLIGVTNSFPATFTWFVQEWVSLIFFSSSSRIRVILVVCVNYILLVGLIYLLTYVV